MAKGGDGGAERKAIAQNRRARHDYEILDTVEAGLVLLGPEVKSLRQGKASLAEAYGMVRGGELWLLNAHVSPYEQAGRDNPDPRRPRKLLLHRAEIARLAGEISERGLTLVPLSMYWKGGRAKVELAVARGKRRADKRDAIREREEQRDIDRAMSRRRRP
jgi:SsrA-binding protein